VEIGGDDGIRHNTFSLNLECAPTQVKTRFIESKSTFQISG